MNIKNFNIFENFNKYENSVNIEKFNFAFNKEKINFELFKDQIKTNTSVSDKEYNNNENNNLTDVDKETIFSYFTKNNYLEENSEINKLLNYSDDEIKDKFSNFNQDYLKQFDNVFNLIQSYNNLKTQKYSLNENLLEKIKLNEDYLNNIRMSESVYNKNELFKSINLREFKNLISINDIKHLPLFSKIKIKNEVENVEKKSKKLGIFMSLIFTPLASFNITNYFYKNFNNEIRNKKRFFIKYLSKIPFSVCLVSYPIFKFFGILFYERQPLINLNQILGDSENFKENEKFKQLRLGINKRFIKNEKEYEKFMKVIYGDNNLINNMDSLNICNKFSTTFIFYERLKYLFFNLNLELKLAKSYINNLSNLDNLFKIKYVNQVILSNFYQNKINKIIEKEIYNLNDVKLNKNKSNIFQFKTSSINSNNKMNNIFYDLLELAYSNNAGCLVNKNKLILIKNFYYFQILHNLQNNEFNQKMIIYYEIQYLLQLINHHQITKVMKNYNLFKSLIQNENEMRKFINHLKTQKEIKLSFKEKIEYLNFPQNELITPEELNQIIHKRNEFTKINYNIILINSVLIGYGLQFFILKKLKII